MSIRFSVITPVFNREKCLGRAIQSVVSQSFENWELILVNDGSTDRSESICAAFARTDSRIHYISQSNAGVSAARNSGLRAASGQYVLFLDADDFLQKDALEILHNRLCANNDPALIFFDTTSEASDDHRPSEPPASRIIGSDELREDFIPAFLNLKPTAGDDISPMVIDKCYRRSVLVNHQIAFEEHYKTWEDGLFNASVLKHIPSLVIIPDGLCVKCDGGYQPDEHLSVRFFPNMPQNWVRQFEIVESLYGDTYDFDAEYALRKYWSIFHDLLKRSAQAHASGEVFSFAVSSETVQRWVKALPPASAKEKLLFSLIRKKKPRLLQCCYGISALSSRYFR